MSIEILKETIKQTINPERVIEVYFILSIVFIFLRISGILDALVITTLSIMGIFLFKTKWSKMELSVLIIGSLILQCVLIAVFPNLDEKTISKTNDIISIIVLMINFILVLIKNNMRIKELEHREIMASNPNEIYTEPSIAI
jgi:MFS-type transporter involved in bile tolerance (Atg22 family)